MKNKFRIVWVIAWLFSLCNFISAWSVTFTWNIWFTNTYYIPVPVEQSSCNFTLTCTYWNTEYLDWVPQVVYTKSTYKNQTISFTNYSLSPSRHELSWDFSTLSDCVHLNYFDSTVTYNWGDIVPFVCVYSWVWIVTEKWGSCSCPDCPTCNICSPYSWQLDLYYYEDWEFNNWTMYGWKYSIYLQSWLNWNGFEDWDSYWINVSSSVPVCTGDSWNDLSWINWSLLYINDIQHIGAWIINITIPEEINRDYLYTWNGDQFDLNVSGYNVDSAYIDWIIRNQKTLPNNVDFNNIVSVLIPKLIPWLVIILFLLFVFRFIKKIF